jgi:hypothetical protein
MDGIGSIGLLAGYAAQPLAAAQSAPAVADPGAGSGGSEAGAALGGLAAQYQMSVLSKVMYASADQALALIQMLPKPSFRAR